MTAHEKVNDSNFFFLVSLVSQLVSYEIIMMASFEALVILDGAREGEDIGRI